MAKWNIEAALEEATAELNEQRALAEYLLYILRGAVNAYDEYEDMPVNTLRYRLRAAMTAARLAAYQYPTEGKQD